MNQSRYTILLCLLIGSQNVNSQDAINLKDWLVNFWNCQVAIHLTGSEPVHVGKFEFPIRLTNSNYPQTKFYINEKYEKVRVGINYNHQKLQPIICAAELRVVTKLNLSWFKQMILDNKKVEAALLRYFRLTNHHPHSSSFRILVLPKAEYSISPHLLCGLTGVNMISWRKDRNDQFFIFEYWIRDDTSKYAQIRYSPSPITRSPVKIFRVDDVGIKFKL